MSEVADAILASLAQVERERRRRSDDASLAGHVRAVKGYQQARLAATYADLAATPRYQAATRFFLDELYGPDDFVQRDAQFARVVPALVRLFPAEVAATVLALAQLHALSERLDSEMGAASAAAAAPGEAGASLALDAAAYARSWRTVGQPQAREQQIVLLLQVGQALDRLTRKRVLRTGLHMMRGPARAAGLEALQRFLETGFDAFGAMGGAREFLQTIAERERQLGRALFAG